MLRFNSPQQLFTELNGPQTAGTPLFDIVDVAALARGIVESGGVENTVHAEQDSFIELCTVLTPARRWSQCRQEE